MRHSGPSPTRQYSTICKPHTMGSRSPKPRVASLRSGNRFRDRTRVSGLRLLLAQFESPIIVLLAVAAVLSFALGEYLDAFIVFTILIVSGLLGFWQEYSATNAVDRLFSLVAVEAEVIRDGSATSVSRDGLVPGTSSGSTPVTRFRRTVECSRRGISTSTRPRSRENRSRSRRRRIRV